MAKRVSATDAKNNFGGLLDDVATLGRVDIVKHGRLVAVVLAPRMASAEQVEADAAVAPDGDHPAKRAADQWGATHMIRAEQARAARMVRTPRGFDED